MSLLKRAADSSVVVRGLRRLVEKSAVVAMMRRSGVGPWWRQTRERIAIGLRGDWSPTQERRTVAQMDVLVSGSRVATAIMRLVAAPAAGWTDSRLRAWLTPVLSLEMAARIRMAGVAIVVAVLTHTVLSALLGVSVQWLGWSMRVGLVLAGVAVAWRPEPLVAAWKDKTGL